MKPTYMVFQAGERLHLGAEAEVWSGTWFGRPAVRKQRRTRAWRHPDLDHRLGHRRMMSEARLMVRMQRAGIAVPALYDLDPGAGIMVMQRMPGRLKNFYHLHVLLFVDILDNLLRFDPLL